MKAAVINTFPMFSAVGTVMMLFILLWTYAADLMFPPIEFGPRMGDVVPPSVYPGERAQLCRDITFSRGLSIELTRQLTQNQPDGSVLNMEFGEMKAIREPGTIPQCRIIQVPSPMPPGEWELHTWITYESWPFWHRRVEAPVVTMIIKDPGTLPQTVPPAVYQPEYRM